MTRDDMIWKISAYGVALVLVAAVNYLVLPLTPMPVPLMVPAYAVGVGCLEGARFGAGAGMAAGGMMAALGHSGWEDVALLCLVGWVCGLLGQYVLRQDLWGHMICCVVMVGLWEGIQLLGMWLLAPAALRVLAALAGGEALSTLVWSVPVYGAAYFCCRRYGRIYHE